MSKELFDAPPDYDMAADIGRAFVIAVTVICCLIFCAGFIIGALAFGGLS